MALKKQYLLFVLLLWGISFSIQAQNTLKGRVIDASNGQPVQFANVGIIDSFMGKATDAEGYFEMNIPDDMLRERVRVSAVGYQARELQINRLVGKDDLTIELMPVIYSINQVDVQAPSRVLYGMLKTALRQKNRNYVTSPYSAHMVYQEKRGEKEKTLRIKYSDHKGYGVRTEKNAFLARNYKIEEGKRNYEQSPFADGLVRVEELLQFDFIRNRGNVMDTVFLDQFRVFEKKKYVEAGKHVIVIGYECLNPAFANSGDSRIRTMKGEIHLVQNNMSIIRHVAHYESDGWSPHGRSFMLTDNMISQPTKGVQYTVETDYAVLQNDQLAVQSIRLKINDFGESQDEEKPSPVFFHLTFEDFLPNQQIVQEKQRDYYDNISEFLPHFRL